MSIRFVLYRIHEGFPEWVDSYATHDEAYLGAREYGQDSPNGEVYFIVDRSRTISGAHTIRTAYVVNVERRVELQARDVTPK